jgi:hypothetical protein
MWNVGWLGDNLQVGNQLPDRPPDRCCKSFKAVRTTQFFAIVTLALSLPSMLLHEMQLYKESYNKDLSLLIICGLEKHFEVMRAL